MAVATFPLRLQQLTTGDIIRMEREAHEGHTQEYCAAKVGCTRRQWGNWEANHWTPNIENTKAICRLYPSLKAKLLSP